MRIVSIKPRDNRILEIVADDGRIGLFDLSPYLELEAFLAPKDPIDFKKVSNGGYFIEWENGADLSADTIEAHLIITQQADTAA